MSSMQFTRVYAFMCCEITDALKNAVSLGF